MRSLALLSLTATLTLSAATRLTIKPTVPIEISRLDECIQIRFLDRTAFGINRIGAMPAAHFQGMRAFRPENPIEQSVVDQLRQKGLEVAAYLVGRQALAKTPASTPRSGLQGPASITLRSDTQFADEASVFSEGKTALASIGQGPGYDLKKGDWNIAIRPLRASNQTCIQCHTTVEATPKLGDALGVVMYVFRQRE
jgi:hypothetical protein